MSIARDLARSIGASVRGGNISSAGELSGGVTAYSSVNNLPTSGNDSGDQAFVSGNNRLYIWNGSGWYNIALINTNPAFDSSGTPESTYALSTEQSTTTITLLATDPEGLVITYSAVADSDFGGLATVSQDSSVFTITPFSNDSATTESGSLTFKASDGVNVASAISEFTLTFRIEHSNYTTLLLKASGNNGTNTGINDASSNNHTVTVNGNAVAQSFTPYHPGGYSVNFDGSGDYLDTGTVDTAFGSSSDWTLELFIYPRALGLTAITDPRTSATSNHPAVWIKSTGVLYYYAGGADRIVGTTVLTTNEWHHVAVVRSSGTTTLYLNGVSEGSFSDSLNYASTTNFRIGQRYSSTPYNYNGFMSDLRVVNGTAVYTANFTPPNERLTAIANTELLVCHLPYLADGSSNGYSITAGGNAHTERFGPYNYLTYNPSSHGASVYFDGTGDYLTVADDASLQPGSSNFTYEAWIYPTSAPNTYNSIFYKRGAGANYSGVAIAIKSSGVFSVLAASGSGSWGIVDESSASYKLNQWQHIAAVRSGSNFYFYVNGVQKISTTISFSVYDMGSSQSIGAGAANGDQPFTGYIADARIVKGSAIYTSAFTPPTAPLTAVTNTQLLTCNDAPNIYNAGGASNALTLGGDAKSSTAQTKYANASILLDGTGDFITIADDTNLDFGSKPFTMEGWYRADDVSGDRYIISSSGGTFDTGHFGVNFYNGSWRVGGFNDKLISGTTGIETNVWHHFALCHNNRQIQFFIDGAQVGSTVDVSADTFNCGGSFQIGGFHSNTGYGNWDGYLEDIRITKGLSRYPFIPFSETLTSNSNTTALLCHTDTIVDGSSNAASITTSGDPTVSDFGPYSGMKSVYFDGNDYFNLETTALGSGDFTVECWVYSADFGDGSYNQIFSFRPGSTSSTAQGSLAFNPSGGYVWWTNTFIIGSETSNPHMIDSTWNHFALVRDNGTLKLFVNGTMTNSVANTQDLSEASLSLGANNDGSEAFTGYISNFRILSTAQYTNSFTSPAAALQA
jgi:hypothetical protein